MMESMAAETPLPLSPLRQELQLSRGAPTLSGKPAWLIFDPVQHRYFELDYEVFQILSLWNDHNDSDSLISDLERRYGLETDRHRIKDVVSFLSANNLVLENSDAAWKRHWARHLQTRVSPLSWLIHNYLYIRIPLVRPSRFLKATLPLVEFFFTPVFVWLTVIAALAGVYFASREWDVFLSTFASFYSFEGIAAYALVLVVIKILHEMGHAYMAVRFGCRVPTMGIALLVMFPVLYTDVTDAWKLRSRRQRLLIGAAGMFVELALAAYATVAWIFLPEGTAKSIAFIVATLSWTMSLLINLNPLMRFDGYYLFSDATGIANLQARSFAVGRWKLREILFGLGHPPPEALPARTLRIMFFFAWSVWVYRFFLFLGIALLVYAYFFKVLGIILFFIEIVWFIGRPAWSELKEWSKMFTQIITRLRSWLTLAMAGGLAVLFFIPGSGRIEIPAVLEPASFTRIFPPGPARLDGVYTKPGKAVKKGDVLFVLSSPGLEQKIKLASIRLELSRTLIARAMADRLGKDQLLSLIQQRETLIETLAGLKREQKELVVRAPMDGVVKDLNRKLHKGRWLKAGDRLATVVHTASWVARGYIAQEDLWRVRTGSTGTFIPDDFLLGKTRLSVKDLSIAGSTQLELPMLASEFGGGIAVRKGQNGELFPVKAIYQVTMKVDDTSPDSSRVLRGIAHIKGRPESMAARIWRRILQVMIRESGA